MIFKWKFRKEFSIWSFFSSCFSFEVLWELLRLKCLKFITSMNLKHENRDRWNFVFFSFSLSIHQPYWSHCRGLGSREGQWPRQWLMRHKPLQLTLFPQTSLVGSLKMIPSKYHCDSDHWLYRSTDLEDRVIDLDGTVTNLENMMANLEDMVISLAQSRSQAKGLGNRPSVGNLENMVADLSDSIKYKT